MSMDETTNHLIDSIYAAMFGEESWQTFLDSLSTLLPNGKSLMFYHDVQSGSGAFALNAAFDESFATAYSEHYAAINPWIHGATTRPLGRVVQADAMLDRRALVRTEFYDGFLRPQNLVSGLGVTIMREEGCNFMVSVLGDDAEDDVYAEAIARVQALTPHLKRAFSWYRNGVGSTTVSDDNSQLENCTRAAILRIGIGRRVRSVNRAASTILRRNAPVVSIDGGQRFQCMQTSVCDHIDATLTTALRGESSSEARSHLVMSETTRTPLRLTLIPPTTNSAERFFRGPECLLVIEEPVRRLDTAAAEYGALHGLTSAETRLVSELASGLSLADVASKSRVSKETLRRQLKSVYAKTGLNRQSEIVRCVASLASIIIDSETVAN